MAVVIGVVTDAVSDSRIFVDLALQRVVVIAVVLAVEAEILRINSL